MDTRKDHTGGSTGAGPSGAAAGGAPPARPGPNPLRQHRGWGTKKWLTIAVILGLAVLGVAGALVYSATSNTLTWREEVALHDGGVLVVSRKTVLLPSPMLGERVDGKRQLSFTHPKTGKLVTWENAGEIGSRVYPMLLDVDGERAFLVTIAQAAKDYDDLGCPTPPYIVFRHDGTAWTRVPLAELPARFRRANVSTISPNRLKDVIKQAKSLLSQR